jgi:hypothetical protein
VGQFLKHRFNEVRAYSRPGQVFRHKLHWMTSARAIRIKNQIAAIWKRGLSFRKRDWEMSDYPVVIREHEFNPDFSAPRFRQHRYFAYIVNWAITGSGDTSDDAVGNLRSKFQSIKNEWKLQGRPLLRPGTVGPIEFASQEWVAVNKELSEDFIRRVLNLDWAWISDESRLWDFHTNETNELLHAKIMEVYSVDVSEIESAKLSEILDRIAAERKTSKN